MLARLKGGPAHDMHLDVPMARARIVNDGQVHDVDVDPKQILIVVIGGRPVALPPLIGLEGERVLNAARGRWAHYTSDGPQSRNGSIVRLYYQPTPQQRAEACIQTAARIFVYLTTARPG